MATRPCELCEKYVFQKDGRVQRFPEHGPDSQPLERPKGTKPPCESCPKITLAGVDKWDGPARPALAVEMSERTRRVYEHYKRCRAVEWNVPDAQDELVQHHAAVIREVEDEQERAGSAAMVGLMGFGGKGKK